MKQDSRVATLGHSCDMLGIATSLVASTEFNEHPLPLHLHGTRETNTGLFRTLDRAPDQARASTNFQDYMSLVVVATVNRGEDADTAGALAGMLAGACYGLGSIPGHWLAVLDPMVVDAIRTQVEVLLALV